MKNIIWLIIFMALVLFVQAQTDSAFKLKQIYHATIETFTADNLGNLYIITPTDQLKKLDPEGDSLAVFNEVRRYGTLYTMDVTNPLKLILYYKDFSTVVTLDRFLNRINTVDLRALSIFQAKAVALSYDNNIWVYDEQASKLKKIGDDGRLLLETVDLRQAMDQVPSPEKIIDRDGFVYLYDPEVGIFVFDYYGTLKNKIPILHIRDIQVIGKTVVGRQQNKFVSYTLGSFDPKEAPLPMTIRNAEKIKIMQQGIYVLLDDRIELYSFK